jgi:hypothetical protein
MLPPCAGHPPSAVREPGAAPKTSRCSLAGPLQAAGCPTGASPLRLPVRATSTSASTSPHRSSSPTVSSPTSAFPPACRRCLPFGGRTQPRAACLGEISPPRRPKMGQPRLRLPPRPHAPRRRSSDPAPLRPATPGRQEPRASPVFDLRLPSQWLLGRSNAAR